MSKTDLQRGQANGCNERFAGRRCKRLPMASVEEIEELNHPEGEPPCDGGAALEGLRRPADYA